jgi:hypothetical protein
VPLYFWSSVYIFVTVADSLLYRTGCIGGSGGGSGGGGIGLALANPLGGPLGSALGSPLGSVLGPAPRLVGVFDGMAVAGSVVDPKVCACRICRIAFNGSCTTL